MDIIEVKTWEAKIYIGGRRGYRGTHFSQMDIIEALNNMDDCPVISYTITKTVYAVVGNGFMEPGFVLGFIQYPRFQKSETILRITVKCIAKFLLDKFEQNRVTIVFPGDTILLQSETAECE